MVWLSVPWRIDYKLTAQVYKCLHGLAPSYLADELHHPAESGFRRWLRSASSRLMNCLFPVPDFQHTTTELFQSPLYGSGTVFRSISHSALSLTSRLLLSLEDVLIRILLPIITFVVPAK